MKTLNRHKLAVVLPVAVELPVTVALLVAVVLPPLLLELPLLLADCARSDAATMNAVMMMKCLVDFIFC